MFTLLAMWADEELDLVGLYCPEPIFRTRQAVEALEEGQVLRVVADDPAAEEDIKRWCSRTGNQLLSFRKEGRLLVFYIRRGAKER